MAMRRRGGGHFHWMYPPPQGEPQAVQRGTVKRVISAFKPYRRKVMAVSVLIVITSALGVVNPLLIKVVFDTALFPHRVVNGHATAVVLPVRLHRLFWLVGFMVAIPMISGSIGVAQTYLANLIGQRVMQDFRNALYRHLQHMPLRFFTSTRTGEIQSRLANDVGAIEGVITDTASSILSNVVILISTL